MHNFDYKTKPLQCLSPEIVALTSKIHECKGRQDLFIETNKDELNALVDIARIQSTGASNRIEGIFTSDKRLEELITNKSEPRNRSEEEIAGYREVLTTIHENYDVMVLRPNIILQLHRDLYSFSSSSIGGTYKNSDNIIAEIGPDGNQLTRFTPVPAFQTLDAMNDLCESFLAALKQQRLDPLILIPMFILDFLCIHPFNDGNGRLSRLLTLLLLYQSGYIVGKYISLEMLIEKTKETYYEVLQDSSNDWHQDENRYEPFVKYTLGILVKAYDEFENRIEHLKTRKMSKPDRIKSVIDRKIGKITKKEIMEICPDISLVTVERTLTDLVNNGYIQKTGAGPSTAYVKK